MEQPDSNSHPDLYYLILLALSFLAFAAGLACMMWAQKYPLVSHPGTSPTFPQPLSLATFAFSLAGAGTILIYLLWRYSAPAPRLLLANAVILTIAFWLILTQLGLVVNGAYDHSPAHAFNVVVTNREMNTGGKGGIRYYLLLQDGRPGAAPIRLPVVERIYDQCATGSQGQMATKTGRLGYEWIVNCSFLPQSG